MAEKLEAVTVVVCAFNEAGTIERELREIHTHIVSAIPGSRLIVAEDGSTDGTKEILKRLQTELNIIHSTSAQRKGYTQALRDAIALIETPWMFFCDTGGKTNYSDFWRLYEARSGADIVNGWRTGRKDAFYRRILTWTYNALIRGYFGVPFHDADTGFRLYRTSLIKSISQQTWVYKRLIGSELMLRAAFMGAVVKEVPIAYFQRSGKSRANSPRGMPKTIWHVVSRAPRLKDALRQLKRSS